MPAVLLIVLLGVGAFALYSYLYSESARTKRALRKTPRRTIADFSEREPGKVVGTLSYLGEPLRSPLTGRTCAYYEIHVEEYRSGSGSNSAGAWHTMIKEDRGQDFSLKDQSGYAIVNPVGASLAITIDSHTRSGTFDDPTDLERSFLNSHGRDGKAWVFNKKLRYKEGILEAGESVAVLGRGTKEPDPSGVHQQTGYREASPMRLRLGRSAKLPLMISDDVSTLG